MTAIVASTRGEDAERVTAQGGPGTTATTTTAPPAPEADVHRPVEPTRLVVPALGLDAPVVALGLLDDGTLEVPATAHEVGWWTGGTVPGDVGPAVLAGHVNLDDEPGVFGRLGELEPGDEIRVLGSDGAGVAYIVERVEQHPKDAFPTDAVYGMTSAPELRLVTCGGGFDRSTRHYVDNVIVFAETKIPHLH